MTTFDSNYDTYRSTVEKLIQLESVVLTPEEIEEAKQFPFCTHSEESDQLNKSLNRFNKGIQPTHTKAHVEDIRHSSWISRGIALTVCLAEIESYPNIEEYMAGREDKNLETVAKLEKDTVLLELVRQIKDYLFPYLKEPLSSDKEISMCALHKAGFPLELQARVFSTMDMDFARMQYIARIGCSVGYVRVVD